MANEISFSFSLGVFKPSVMSAAMGRAINGLQLNWAGTTLVYGTVSIGTSATAFPLGSVTAPHVSVFNNTDTTNFFTLRNGAAGADLGKWLAGEIFPFPMLDTAVPYGVANTAAVTVEYLIISL